MTVSPTMSREQAIALLEKHAQKAHPQLWPEECTAIVALLRSDEAECARLRERSAAARRPDPEGLKRSEAPFTFPGGTVPVPVLRDVQNGDLFYSADTVQVMFNLKHHFSPPAGTADALLRQWWAADRAVDAAEIALRSGQPDAAELFLKAEAAMVAADDAIRTHFAGGGS